MNASAAFRPSALGRQVAFALAALLSAFTVPSNALGLEHVFALDVEFETTSDWARFAFEDLQIHVVSRQLTVAGGGYVRSDSGYLAKASYDSSKVSLRARIHAIVTGPKPRIVLGKGNTGASSFRLRAGRTTIATVQHDGSVRDDDENRHFQPLDARVLADLPGARLKHHERLAMAFYYGWYGTPTGATGRWRHWNPGKPHYDSLNQPVGGWYDSLDPQLIERHCQQARAAGIDVLIVSWWTDKQRNAKLLALLQPAALRHGLRLTVYVETAASAKALRAEIKALVDGPGQHKTWLRADGKPVVFLYTRILGALKPKALQSAIVGAGAFVTADTLDVARFGDFDALHTYYIARKTEQYRQALLDLRRLTRLTGKRLIATVMPGYNDTPVRNPGFVRPRSKTRYLRDTFAAATGADWVLLTSFNEWHEGSEIEPSVQYGDTYIKLFAQLVDRWRTGP